MSDAEHGMGPSRRGLVAGLSALAWAAQARAQEAGEPQASGKLTFAVFRNGAEIGRHAVDVRISGDDATAEIDAAFTVKIGPVPVFRYRHEATELWRGGRFASLKSSTVSNGSREQVSAVRTGSGVVIDCAKGRLTAAGDAAPLTHWNSAALRRPLFNPQTGALLRDTVGAAERSNVKLYDGRVAPATRYVLAGESGITDFYDPAGRWIGLRGVGPDKSVIEYRRMV